MFHTCVTIFRGSYVSRETLSCVSFCLSYDVSRETFYKLNFIFIIVLIAYILKMLFF